MNTEESRRAAVGLIRRGAAPIPVPAGEKNPRRTGWEALRISEEDVPRFWTNGQNVGLLCGEPSGNRVDVDLDADEAVEVANRFLPPTLTSGRESRPHSHWWYVASGVENSEWKDTDGKKLVELRGTGRQTLVEPSRHPSGERYTWSRGGLEMATMDAPALVARCVELATAVLIARHLPEHRDAGGGGRHDYAMALAGFLLRPDRLEEDLTLKILVAAWDAKGWPNEGKRREAHRDLEGVVRDTARDIADGEPVVGGPTLEEMVPGMVRLLRRYWGWRREEQGQDAPAEDKEDRRNQADRLIGYALEDVEELFLDQHGAPHVLVGGEPVPLTSRCYSWLRRLMWDQEKKAVNGEYLKTAAGTLAAHAEFGSEVRELHTRAAWHEGILYYELRPGRVMRCGADGWGEAEPSSLPVLFRRYPNLKPLPDPEPEGPGLDALDGLVNLKSSRDRRLFKAYLATIALPHVPRPILNVHGPMGSGKTTAGRVAKRLWDPTAPETVRYDPRDFLQKAGHANLVMLDNLSALPESAADTICRLVTGEADSKRRLYTDDEDVIVELKRAVILNGINVPTDRGDVLDRSLVVELERIPDGARETEEQLWERFEAEHPKLLGALFGALAEAIALKASLQLSRRPRLADWGEYASAVYEVMGWGVETFLEDWDEVVKAQNVGTLDGSPVAQVIIEFMRDRNDYEGSATDLHNKLEGVAEDVGVNVARDKAWPKSARWLWRKINEVLPLLLAAGIEARRERPQGATVVSLRKASIDNASDANVGEEPLGKPDTARNTPADGASSNASGMSNASSNASPNSAYLSGSRNTRITRNRSGGFSETPASFDAKPGEDVTVEALQARKKDISEAAALFRRSKSGPALALKTYLEKPNEERLMYLTKAVLTARKLDTGAWQQHAQAVETAALDPASHPLDCECEECA